MGGEAAGVWYWSWLANLEGLPDGEEIMFHDGDGNGGGGGQSIELDYV